MRRGVFAETRVARDSGVLGRAGGGRGGTLLAGGGGEEARWVWRVGAEGAVVLCEAGAVFSRASAFFHCAGRAVDIS